MVMDVRTAMTIHMIPVMTIPITTGAGAPMTMDKTSLDDAALYRLMTWLSPGFPVGAYAYSHGIEWVVESGDIHDMESLAHWLEDLCRHGGGRSDAILFQHAWTAAREDETALESVNDLAMALSPSRERRLESVNQGRPFLIAITPAWPWRGPPDIDAFENRDLAYPVAVAMAAAGHGVHCAPPCTPISTASSPIWFPPDCD